MRQLESIEELVATVEVLQEQTLVAQIAVRKHIGDLHPNLAVTLDTLYPGNVPAQARWLFRQLFRQKDRPIDLLLTGHIDEVNRIATAIAYGNYL